MLLRYKRLGKPDASKYYSSKPHYLTKVTGERAYSSNAHKRKLADFNRIDIGSLRCPNRHAGENALTDRSPVGCLVLTTGRVLICRVLTYPQKGNGLSL
jgi:hypothetical protein